MKRSYRLVFVLAVLALALAVGLFVRVVLVEAMELPALRLQAAAIAAGHGRFVQPPREIIPRFDSPRARRAMAVLKSHERPSHALERAHPVLSPFNPDKTLPEPAPAAPESRKRSRADPEPSFDAKQQHAGLPVGTTF